MLHPTNNNRIRPTRLRRVRMINGHHHICSVIVMLLTLLASNVDADLRGDSFERRSYSTTPSNWVDFSIDRSGRKEQDIVIVNDTIENKREPSEVKWRNLATGSHVSIGISDMIMGKGKGKGGSSSKGGGSSKAGSSSSKGSSDCDNIFSHDSADSGKGGKGKGGDRGGIGSGGSSSKSGNTGKGGYSGKGSGGSGSKGGCYDDDAPTPTSSGDGFPSPTPPAVPGFPIFSEEPVAPDSPTRSPSGSGTGTESPVMAPTPIREPTSDGRCMVGSDGLFGSQLGLSEETEFAYQTTVTPSVTAAELDLDILQRVERAMAPLVLEQLFNRCNPSEGAATERMKGQRLRKLQGAEIEGWSTKPSDIVIQNVPCVEVDEIFPCFVIQGKTTAYAEGKISETTRQSLANAVRVAIENGNLATSDNRLLEVTYRDLNRFPIPDSGGPGDGGQGGDDGSGDGGSGGRDPSDIDDGLDPDDGGLQSWAIALIAVGGALTLCFAYLCLRRPSHSSLDVDDSSSSSSSSSSGSSSSSSESDERYPLKSTPEPPVPPPAPRPVFSPPAAAPAPAPTPREPTPSSPPGGDGMRLVKVIKRASAKPSPKVAPAPTFTAKAAPSNSDSKSSPSASGSSVGTPVEQASSAEGSYDEQIDRPSPHKQASAFTLDMGEDLRDNASGLTTDLEFSQPSVTNNEFNKPQNEFGGINEFERAPSSHDPGSSAGTPSSSYEEVVEEYEIEYDDEDEGSGSGVGQDDESSEVFWDEELNDMDDNEFAVSADLR